MKFQFARMVAGAVAGSVGALASGAMAEGAQPGARSAGPSLCRAGEQALFQCRIGARTVSLCGGTGAANQAYVQYRFGRPGQVELAYPEGGSGTLSWASTGYSGGGE